MKDIQVMVFFFENIQFQMIVYFHVFLLGVCRSYRIHLFLFLRHKHILSFYKKLKYFFYKIQKAYLNKMNKTVLNEDTENIIKSYIPNIERWKLLRKLYNDSFLREGLEKKTVVQLTLIQKNLIEMVDSHEVSNIWYLFRTYSGKVLKELEAQTTITKKTKNRLKSALDQWRSMSISGNKKEKIENIIKFINRLDNIIQLNLIIIDFKVSINFEISLIKYRLNENRQHFWASKALKILLLLVSILKNKKKTRRKGDS